MYAVGLFVFFAALVAGSAGILLPSEKVLQGPSSKTTLVGPDGSVISSLSPGGQVIADESSGSLAHAAPVVAIQAAPVVASPIVAAPEIATPIIAAPVALDGVQDESHVAVQSSEPVAVAVGKSLILPGVPAGHGLEGRYVHDYTENLYDDGSYKAQ